MDLIERAKNIVIKPASEWLVIEPEMTPARELYLQYILPLAAIGPVAQILGLSIFGFGSGFHLPLMLVLSQAIVSYVLTLVLIFVMALIVNALAPSFGATKSTTQSLKLVAYAFTPGWLAGILHLVPTLATLVLLAALYGIYLVYLGIPVLMRAPKEKAAGYTAVVVICMIILGVIIGSIVGGLVYMGGGRGMFAAGMADRAASRAEADVLAAQIAAQSAQIRAGQATGSDQSAQAAQAAVASMATALAGGANAVDAVDKESLKALLPDTVGGLPRTSIEANRSGVGNLIVAEADAEYSDGQNKHVKLTVSDLAGVGGLGGAAAWALVEQDRSSDSGYEKMGKVNGTPTHEKFDKNSGQGEYAILLDNRFMVDAEGTADMSDLKSAVTAVDSGKLDAMKLQGVHKAN